MGDYRDIAFGIIQQCGTANSHTAPVNAIMDVISEFLNPNSKMYEYIRRVLDPNAVNPEVDIKMLSDVLLNCRESQSEVEEVSTPSSGNSFESITSQDYRDCIVNLKSKVRENEHTILRLQNDLERNIQNNEETITLLIAERDDVKKSLKSIKCSVENFSIIKDERDDLVKQLDQVHTELANCHAKIANLTKTNNDLEFEKLKFLDINSTTKEETNRRNRQLLKQQQIWQLECGELKERLCIALEKVEELEDVINSLRHTNEALHSEIKSIRSERVDEGIFLHSHFTNFSDDSMDCQCGVSEENDNESKTMSIYEEFKHTIQSYPDVCQKTNSSSVVTNNMSTQVEIDDGREMQDAGVQVSYEDLTRLDVISCTSHDNRANVTRSRDERINFSERLAELQKTNTELHNVIKALIQSVSEYAVQVHRYYFLTMSVSSTRYHYSWINELKMKLINLQRETEDRAEFMNKLLEHVKHHNISLPKEEGDIQMDSRGIIPVKQTDNKLIEKYDMREAEKWKFFQRAYNLCAIICFVISIVFLHRVSCYMYTLSNGHPLQVIPLSWLRLEELFSIFFKIEYHGEAPV